MHYLGYLFFRIIVFLFSLIPFGLLYKISNGLAWFFLNVLKYRKAIVFDNLQKCFPEKDEAEILQIAKASYRNLSDILLESFKGMSMTNKQIHRHYRFINPEILNDYFDKKQNLMMVASHYNNWEWATAVIGLDVKHDSLGIYKPIKNKYINDYIVRVRTSEKVFVAPTYETSKALEKTYERPIQFVFIADQNPSNWRKADWIKFLGRDTACLHGADRKARAYNLPVVHAAIERIERGRYEVELSILCADPTKTTEGEITKLFMGKLEQRIREKPANWLWSHKRWKHTKPATVEVL